MSEQSSRLLLTGRFTDAVEYARQLHTEYRKGTDIPYMAHLLGVAAIVMGEAGGGVPVTEDMVIAAVLHDAVEDHGGMERLEDVKNRFGANVARMVAGLSDTFVEDPHQKEEYEERKSTYIQRLSEEADDVLLISAADKLYNAKATLEDFREIGHSVFDRFSRGASHQIWYFNRLLEVFDTHPRNRVVNEFERVVRELESLIAGTG